MGCSCGSKSIGYKIQYPDGTLSDETYKRRSEANAVRSPEDRIKPVMMEPV